MERVSLLAMQMNNLQIKMNLSKTTYGAIAG